MRVKSRLVWNLGSAWLCPSAMARMSSSSRGRWSSAGLRRRSEKASTQVMPLRSSCMALRIVPRFHPRWASAHTCPPRPMAWTVLAMKARRWLPLRALAVSMRTGIISGAGRISVTPEALRAKPTGYRTLFFFQAPKTDRLTLPHAQDVGYDLATVLMVRGDDGAPTAPAVVSLTTADGVKSPREDAPPIDRPHIDQ